MAEYKITRISQDAPREWGEGEKKTFYIKCMVEGHDKAISVGKKTPDALKVGDVIYGTITETEYDTDKFTADKPAFGGGGKSFQPKDEAAIKAMWAIGQAVSVLAKDGSVDPGEVKALAIDLFGLVDEVKNPDGLKTAVDAPKRDWASVGKKQDPEYDSLTDDSGQPIPF